jgi:hypothetical protein
MLPCSSTSASIVVCTRLVYHHRTRHGPSNLRISCEAPICSGFVSCIDEMDSSPDSVGIDVPESVLCRQGGAHPWRTILL